MKTRMVVLVLLVNGCGLTVPPYLSPDSGVDAQYRDSPESGLDARDPDSLDFGLDGPDRDNQDIGVDVANRDSADSRLDVPDRDSQDSGLDGSEPSKLDSPGDVSDRNSLDSGVDTAIRDSPDWNIPEPAKHHLMVADYDNNLGVLIKDRGEYCARRPLEELKDICSLPGENNLGQCAASTFCDQGANGNSNYSGSICLTYDEDQSIVLRGEGRSLRLDFDLTLASEYSGYTESIVSNKSRCTSHGHFNLDSLAFSHLTFWIRFQTRDGNKPIDMEIAMKDAQGFQTTKTGVGKRRLSEFSPCVTVGEWKKYCIKFDDLKIMESEMDGSVVTSVDTKNLTELNFVFSRIVSDGTGKSLAGTVWIDEIAFELLE
jgi:hypothetical protein